MRRKFVIVLAGTLLSCGASDIDPFAENHRATCGFLVSEMRSVSSELLDFRFPIDVIDAGPCTCGVRDWRVVNADGTRLRICLENGMRMMMFGSGKPKFGIGTCHNKPTDIVFPVGSAEEHAVISAFSLWIVDSFSVEALYAAEIQPDKCRVHDMKDPVFVAESLISLFNQDPERFQLAHEILACDDLN